MQDLYARTTAARPARPATTMEPDMEAAPPVNLGGVEVVTEVEFLDGTGMPEETAVTATAVVGTTALVGMTTAVEVAGQALTVTVTTDGAAGALVATLTTEDGGGTTKVVVLETLAEVAAVERIMDELVTGTG